MRGFYALLVAVAVIGGGALWYSSRQRAAPAPAPSAPPPAAAADGFRGYTMGSDAARIEVTEYSDFECPFCASFAAVQMPVIREQVIATGRVRWRFRDFPLPSHQYSRYAALAAQCGGEQGKFWEMHDQLFGHHEWAQTGKNPRSLFRDFAKTVGLDLDKYDACMDSQRYAGRIQTSVQEGEAAGVQGTPSFFVNGKRFTGRATSDAFKALADSLTHTRK
ncbi:MAG TPA: DsbA family protein [Gemmatimonadales bacterium]|nr:DsbA family protein [Gemmatimonadales bacterium]